MGCLEELPSVISYFQIYQGRQMAFTLKYVKMASSSMIVISPLAKKPQLTRNGISQIPSAA